MLFWSNVLHMNDNNKNHQLFHQNVRGKKAVTDEANLKHNGKKGHWLEKQMGVKHNADNKPDLFGYEMKNATKTKTSFGDWMASYYIYEDLQYKIDKNGFIKIFGTPKPKKNNRYSWSGTTCPKKVGVYTPSGQTLEVDDENNVLVKYSFSIDTRQDKNTMVPAAMKKDDLIIARWDSELMRKRVEDKFNQQGWFKCLINKDGIYTEIVFGDPIPFEKWINDLKSGHIIFDGGMTFGKSRRYSIWRANNPYWESLITDRH